MPKLLLIDHYDSFTYNLVQYFQQLGVEVKVAYCDAISVAEAAEYNPDFLVFSPGPGTVENPDDVGSSEDLLQAFRGKIPILGVCLGHQLIGKIFGGTIAKVEPQHGKRWPIKVLDKKHLFVNFPDQFEGMRYHSMIVGSLPVGGGLNVTAVTDDSDQFIMAFEKSVEKIFGVQFHPESVGTGLGLKILENFINSKA